MFQAETHAGRGQLRQQLAASRKEAAELRRVAARQEQRIAELESVLNKIEKATVRLKAG